MTLIRQFWNPMFGNRFGIDFDKHSYGNILKRF